MSRITLLDGGMGQELVHRAGDRPTPLWSTQVMVDHPGLVRAVHDDYFAAGATIATVNSYALHLDRLLGTPLEGQQASLIALSLAEAQAAREAHGAGRIAGSIGPLIASYRPDIHPAHDIAVPLYAELARGLATGCQLLICETVASVDHARAALAGAILTGLPVWLALTVDDGNGTRLRSGEAIADVIEVAQQAEAVLVNCSTPEAIPAALDILAKTDKPFGAYANGFTRITEGFLQDKPTVDTLSARQDLGPAAYAAHAMAWIAQGATIVGGCCEVGPAHILELAHQLRAAGHEVV
ncbi:MAG: homocysteine S-methyltransferase family protein [Paracoccaceae bacterium]|uniref:homocysteine S-methyltransferase family protein n=1 Tax=Seohaeicola saemankumensis TaxID=481181 RepID=UPI001E4467E1|nr:homocysteine S-methyltransferase family protein [Seohaeicola saemankumensis]MCD1625232.1 homocysteine S-methyltransferase family protein [Seohaeicola saemankumensis]